MGHADRSRFDNALGLDAESRRVRLPSAGRGSDSDTNANTYGYSNTNGHCNTNSHCYGYADADFHAQTDADAEVSANTKASSYSAAPSITPDIEH
jgi:hypothetical protein